MQLDDDTCYRAMVARDSRFDGRFFVGVLTTGVYCRPVCPARTPHRRNVRFFASAAAASAAGLRACRRCRPDSLPGSREWDHRSDLVARALRLIGSGQLDESGVTGVAGLLGVSERHLRRQLQNELGTSPVRLARTRRAQTARLLVEQTSLPITDVAFAAGFGSLRQFNDVMKDEFGIAPRQLRRHPFPADGRRPGTPGAVTLRLRLREPYDRAAMLSWLRRHAVPAVDEVDSAAAVVRTTAIDGTGIRLQLAPGSVTVRLQGPPADSLTWLPARVAAIRQWLDLDANPDVVTDALAQLAPVRQDALARPGVRVVGAADPFRGLVTAILSQQVSVAAAATHAGRLVAFAGGDGPARFPSPDRLAEADPDALAQAVGVPRARGRTLITAAAAVAGGAVELGPHADRDETVRQLLAIPGIGPWTAGDLRMRAMADPDVWPAADLVIRRETGPGGRWDGLVPQSAAPWRSYAAHLLWVALAAEREQRRRTARNGAGK